MYHDRAFLGGTALSRPLIRPHRYTKDAFQTFDRATLDSAGAFLIGELERLDPMIHEPLIAVTWDRDIDLRTDVQMGDTSSSYTLSTFGMAGGASPAGLNWASMDQTSTPRVTLDIQKVVNPLDLWAAEVAYTVPELESARLTGRPIDSQMLAGLNRKHQMDLDQVVYIGDSAKGTTGLVNSSNVTNTATVAATGNQNGQTNSTLWVNKTADQIRTDVNEILTSVWAATGYAVPPTDLLISPTAMGYISTTIASSAANETILSFLLTRNILTAEKGIPLNIKSVKWLATANRSGATSDRMVAYVKRPDMVRFPMVPLMPATTQYEGIWVKVPYYGRLGVVETVYPETIAYRDGIN